MNRYKRDTVRTGEIAKTFGVAPRTVAGWVDSGMLPGFRVPPTTADGKGARSRVVTMSDAIAFAKKHGLPMGRIPPHWYALGGHVVSVALPEWTATPPGFCHEVYADYVDFLASGKSAAVMVLDMGPGRSQAVRVLTHVVANSPAVKVILIAAEDGEGELPAAVARNVHVVRQRPFDVRDLDIDVAECLRGVKL